MVHDRHPENGGLTCCGMKAAGLRRGPAEIHDGVACEDCREARLRRAKTDGGQPFGAPHAGASIQNGAAAPSTLGTVDLSGVPFVARDSVEIGTFEAAAAGIGVAGVLGGLLLR